MKFFILHIVLAVLCDTASGQNCNCPGSSMVGHDHNRANIVFSLGKQKNVGLCGYREEDKKDTIYSGFIVFECKDKVAFSSFKEWGAQQPCKIQQKSDTIIVAELTYLPVGKNFSFIAEPLYINKIYFRGKELGSTSYYNQELPKYTNDQIDTILGKFKELSKGNNESTIEVAVMLFWAFMSGSYEAEKCFVQIEKKFGPFDGHIAEEWQRTFSIYLDYKQLLFGERQTISSIDY